MQTRHWGKALVGLVVMALTIGALSPPASADTADIDITGGELDIFASDSSLYDTLDLGDSGTTECSPSSGTMTTSGGTGVWTFIKRVIKAIGGTVWKMLKTVTVTVTISITGGVTVTSTMTSQLKQTTSCSGTTTDCTISTTGITSNGTTTITGGVIDASDTSTMSGTSGDHGGFEFNTVVTGTNCGALIAVDDGSVVFTNMVLHATT